MLESINSVKRKENESFIINGNNAELKLLDYWKWAHSDLVSNAERGTLAEFIVSMAMGVNSETRVEWDSYDLETNDGIKIEVKSSGYIQSWYQNQYSSIKFGIRPTQAFNKDNNVYEYNKKRQADVYVFCVHKHKEQDTINPLDLQQWEFYVLNSKILNEKVPKQKSIMLSRVIDLGAIKCEFENLNMVVKDQYNKYLDK